MKAKKPTRSVLIKSLSLIVIILVFSGCQYMWRYMVLNYPGTDDYKKFPSNTIHKAEKTFVFEKGETISIDVNIKYKYKGNDILKNLAEFLEETQTTSFIVIKDDKIVFEKYFLDYQPDEPHMLFSGTKSFVSALVGIAINEGFIKSVDESIDTYIEELKGKDEGKVSIKQLLNMTSGYKYKEGVMPWTDDCIFMYTPNKRKTALKNAKKEEDPGLHHHYNNYHHVLLGIILERTSGMTVSKLFETYLWKKIQTQYDAIWTLDSKRQQCEKTVSGLAVSPIDLAKFGRLYLNKGKWNNQQVISQEWVEQSTSWNKDLAYHDDYYTKYNWEQGFFWFEAGGYNKYSWWCYLEEDKDYVFTAEGYLGQVLHVDPQRNMIVIRTGKKWGETDWWIDNIRIITETLYKNM